MDELPHFNADGGSHMVDVSGKPVTHRQAVASARVVMQASTLQLIQQGQAEKGNVLEVARLAGIMAAKRTGDLIPLCHPLPISSVNIELFGEAPDTLVIRSQVGTEGKTGVEMEALVAASTAALTVYDMVKSADRGVVIERVQLEHKSGGKTGVWNREGQVDR
ncbi:cyclic pyranopterin monophosphate synthase MoaC [Aeoliella mucimassa]|uniref:Cyclic pyranopterin monophosphate synthase n=1 Tax=Aeoliella mucimassa TaxID=2527972 RepID=A0A518ART2_9BACT|nr:cyclic pyranopterin monophosphate synthase MoaC [Aeoliella mucimassa]QDU57424.1 Cyclic pyranopterin monophosphate synthase accessory protein [Aeoliella mucimassa]